MHAPRNPTVGIVSLGCPKALVDSERILTRLRASGYAISPDYAGADVVLVNTCGFLDSAREESLNAIGEAIAENGRVIVTGCLGAEADLIRERHPKVLAISGPQQYESVVNAVYAAVPPIHDPLMDLVPEAGLRLTPRHYAYLKISEGCNNRCSFCIIPKLRGDLVSRPIHHVLIEAERLVKAGVKELLVISQDTSAYGVDVKYAPQKWRDKEYRTKFIDLAKGLGELGAWVRLHYVYPYPHVDEVMPLMAEGKILPYLDIPFQHASPSVLKNMKRPAASEKVIERLKKWRGICPDLTVRSTFIVGFPGETEQDFDYLLQWLKEAQIDRAGCFKYENVSGAPSRELGSHVPEDVKEERWHRFMQAQQEISVQKCAAKVGKILPVLIDSVEDGEAIGRTQADAPEIDGVIRLPGAGLKQGDLISAEVTGAAEYDLFGERVMEKRMPAEFLVTGAAGFIGFHLAKRLLDEGKNVHGIDSLNAYYDVSLKEARLAGLKKYENFSFTKLDIADAGAVQKLFSEQKPRIVLHMAAQAGVRYSLEHPEDYISANLAGFFSILEACRHNKVAHLLYASSSSVYGGNTKVPFSEADDVSQPVSLYAATKRSNELMAHSYAHLFKIPMTALRFFTVYGPWGRPDMALFLFARGILKNEPIPVYNHGKMSRDFTYVDDVVEAVTRLIDRAPDDKNAPHRILNIGNHKPEELESLITILEKLIGKKAIKDYQPLQPGDVPRTFADVEALKGLTGFVPKTTLEEGVSAFLAWFRAYYKY